MFNQFEKNAIMDAEVTESDIIRATDELRENLATGADGILAIFFKKQRD